MAYGNLGGDGGRALQGVWYYHGRLLLGNHTGESLALPDSHGSHHEWAGGFPRNIVDDVIVQVVGTSKGVINKLGKAGQFLFQEYAVRGLILEGKKSHFLASSSEVDARLVDQWARRGIKRKACVRNGGTDAHLQCCVTLPTAKKRLAEGKRRHGKVMRLRRLGAKVGQVQRASPTAQGLRGSAVHGLRPAERRGLKIRALRAARGTKKRGSPQPENAAVFGHCQKRPRLLVPWASGADMVRGGLDRRAGVVDAFSGVGASQA